MEFEQLLRKYFDGAMTEAELERFQTLLENVPEYRTELRQSLEVRSLLHDDALNLKPPTDLSEHIRIAVGASFEADAIVEQQQQSISRGLFSAPLRISAGVLAACCLLVGVALSPTLPHPAMTSLPAAPALPDGSGPVAASSGNGAIDGPKAASVASLPKLSHAAAHAAVRHDGDEDRPAIASSTAPAEDYMALLGHEVAEHPMATASEDNGGINIAQLEPSTVLRTPISSRSGSSSDILTHDPAELLSRGMMPSVAYNPSSDSVMSRHNEPQIAQAAAVPGQAVSGNRTLTIGVTLGAGQVAENKSPTALLQNSYYFSFSVSGYDRIGVEMGASAFQQATSSSSQNGGGTAGPFAKGSAGMPTEDVTRNTAPYSSPTSTQPVPQSNEQRLEQQQITYGAVFYDRRIRLSKTWDLCGRLAVGAANDALIGNLRAYAAYTIPNKGVTLTMGVGGSTLYNLTSKPTANSSGNYGIYYGVETGF